MQEYQIKRGFKEGLKERMYDGLEESFGIKPEDNDGVLTISSGAFRKLSVKLGENEKTIVVDTESDITLYDNLPEEEADKIVLETSRKYNKYLEFVTGYNTKERKKKAADAAKKSR
ncbi:DUF5611 family protein [Methanoplanus endosymbiosus]|uniref:DUF5611 family protein n=1 Tax=Methanoplanus endosymbiosus TaxID=33865 RepID=A0A9E7PM84_9EURY|nr:DUF5611 family protein [Methanoplanus endosymbiosus]UUX92795.1 DUF5611 family protein [Methanoplanus endosymbiosus]